MKHSDPLVRAKAIEVMSTNFLGPFGEGSISLYTAALKDENSRVRLEAANALLRNRQDEKADLERLALHLHDKNRSIRYRAMDCLRIHYQASKKSAVHDRIETLLKECIQGKDSGLRLRAIHTHVFTRLIISPGDLSIYLPILAEGLGDYDAADRHIALSCLHRLGKHAAPAIEALTRALDDEVESHRILAMAVLENLGTEAKPAVKRLARTLEDPNIEVRIRAIVTLGKLGPDAVTATPSLINALKDKVNLVRLNAAEALGLIGPGAKDAIPHLTHLQQDPNELIRRAASQALVGIRAEKKK